MNSKITNRKLYDILRLTMSYMRSYIVENGEYNTEIPPVPVLTRCDACVDFFKTEYVDLGAELGKVRLHRDQQRPYYVSYATPRSKGKVIYVDENCVLEQ